LSFLDDSLFKTAIFEFFTGENVVDSAVEAARRQNGVVQRDAEAGDAWEVGRRRN
jgi:hypothetical protein